MKDNFIAYIGESDIHDGIITHFEKNGTIAKVSIKAESGRIFNIEFNGVKEIKSNKPEGMMLYSLSEIKHPEYRLFIFTNWDEKNDSCLEIVAENYKTN